MASEFDADRGVLRLEHGTLLVLAQLAVAPTDPSLHDHDVAPHVAELRRLEILSSRGMHPAVVPLARAVGMAQRTFIGEAADHGELRRFRGWIAPKLAVVGLQGPGSDELELMADAPAMLPQLLLELVGLGAAPDPPVSGARVLPAIAMARLAQRGPAVTPEEVEAALGPDGARDGWVEALTNAVKAASLRWRVAVGDAWLEVVDAGRSGLWSLEPAPADDPDADLDDTWPVRLAPTTRAEVLERLSRLL